MDFVVHLMATLELVNEIRLPMHGVYAYMGQIYHNDDNNGKIALQYGHLRIAIEIQ